jgi:hypothetical protein
VADPAPWKKLAAELLEFGIDSTYLARIEARVTPDARLEHLEAEIAQEMASALGRTASHVDLALAQLELHKARYDRAVRHGATFQERSELAAAYNAQRSVAQARLRDLAIHREAIGFRRNQILNEFYPIPPKLNPQRDA